MLMLRFWGRRCLVSNPSKLLVSGEKIALAGLECNAKMFRYTQALFLGSEPDFLVCLPSGYVASIRLCLVCDVVGVGRPGFRVLAGD